MVKSPDHLLKSFEGSEGNLIRTGKQYFEAIENADGVPFQLIFGQETGCGYYLNVGHGLIKLLGLDESGLSEKLFNEMIEEIVPLYDNIPSDLNESRKKFIAGEIKRYKADVLITTPAGVKKWIRDTSLPIKDELTGKVIGSFGILFDISDSKLAQEHLEKANEKAGESERLKTAFLRNISHEVRTPLNAIVGFSNLLCDSENEHSQLLLYRDIINNSSDLLLEVLNNIVEVSRLDAKSITVKRSEVNISRVMQSILAGFNAEAKSKKIRLESSFPFTGGDLIIVSDEIKLTRVINCLVSNAIKFTSVGGVDIGYSLLPGSIEFFVTDTGIGIHEEHKPNIFNRFYQAESGPTMNYPGIGLGLSITKAYVELMGGSIWFTSEQGRGTTFRFDLPLAK